MNIFTILGKTGVSRTIISSSGESGFHGNSSFVFPRKGKIWVPVLFSGLCFILLAVLLIVHPELLAFFFAGVMMFLGLFLISVALFLRAGKNQTIL
jgi:hypothetical protein